MLLLRKPAMDCQLLVQYVSSRKMNGWLNKVEILNDNSSFVRYLPRMTVMIDDRRLTTKSWRWMIEEENMISKNDFVDFSLFRSLRVNKRLGMGLRYCTYYFYVWLSPIASTTVQYLPNYRTLGWNSSSSSTANPELSSSGTPWQHKEFESVTDADFEQEFFVL